MRRDAYSRQPPFANVDALASPSLEAASITRPRSQETDERWSRGRTPARGSEVSDVRRRSERGGPGRACLQRPARMIVGRQWTWMTSTAPIASARRFPHSQDERAVVGEEKTADSRGRLVGPWLFPSSLVRRNSDGRVRGPLHACVDAVLRYTTRCVGRLRDVAEDITSEVFLTLHRNLGGIDVTQLPGLAVCGRPQPRRGPLLGAGARGAALSGDAAAAETTWTPPLEMWLRESKALKPVHRACLILRYVHGMERVEIAGRLGLSEMQVKGHLHTRERCCAASSKELRHDPRSRSALEGCGARRSRVSGARPRQRRPGRRDTRAAPAAGDACRRAGGRAAGGCAVAGIRAPGAVPGVSAPGRGAERPLDRRHYR